MAWEWDGERSRTNYHISPIHILRNEREETKKKFIFIVVVGRSSSRRLLCVVCPPKRDFFAMRTNNVLTTTRLDYSRISEAFSLWCLYLMIFNPLTGYAWFCLSRSLTKRCRKQKLNFLKIKLGRCEIFFTYGIELGIDWIEPQAGGRNELRFQLLNDVASGRTKALNIKINCTTRKNRYRIINSTFYSSFNDSLESK